MYSKISIDAGNVFLWRRHARTMTFAHSSIELSMTLCSDIDQTLLQFSDATSFRLVDSLQHFSLSFGQSDVDCWGLAQNYRGCLPFQKTDCLACSVWWCFVLLDHSKLTTDLTRDKQ